MKILVDSIGTVYGEYSDSAILSDHPDRVGLQLLIDGDIRQTEGQDRYLVAPPESYTFNPEKPGELETERQKESMSKIIQLLQNKEESDGLDVEVMMQLVACKNEFEALGRVKLDRYPKALNQIGIWTNQGKL